MYKLFFSLRSLGSNLLKECVGVVWERPWHWVWNKRARNLSDNYPALILYFSCFCRLAATEGSTTQVIETRLLHHSLLYVLCKDSHKKPMTFLCHDRILHIHSPKKKKKNRKEKKRHLHHKQRACACSDSGFCRTTPKQVSGFRTLIEPGCGQLAGALRTLPHGVMSGTVTQGRTAVVRIRHPSSPFTLQKKMDIKADRHPAWDWQLWAAAAGIVTTVLASRSQH